MKYLNILMLIILLVLFIRGLIIFTNDIIKAFKKELKKRRLMRILEDIRKDLN